MQRHRLSLLIGIALVGTLGGIYGMASTILLSSFVQVEQQQVKGDIDQAVDAIEDEVNLLYSRVLDYATWDETHEFVQGKNPGFCETELTDITFIAGDVNFSAIALDNGKVLCTHGFDLTNRKQKPFVNSLRKYLTADLLLNNPTPTSEQQGMIHLPEGLLVVASRPVLDTDGQGPILGSIVMGKYLNATVVERLSQSTRLSLMVQPLDDRPLPKDFQNAQAALSPQNPVVVTPLNSDWVAGYTCLKDLYGKPIAILRVKTSRTVYQQGILSLKYLAVALLLLGGAAGGVIGVLLKRAVESLRDRDRLEQSLKQEAILRQSETNYRIKAEELEQTLQALQQAQAHLIQSEKMSSLGQLVAGIAHEINNPISFIHGNIVHLKNHVQDLMALIKLYQQYYPTPCPEVQTQVVKLDAAFLLQDLPLILASIQSGSERIREIVLSLRNFSRLDESEMKFVNIHEGIDSALLILQNRLNVDRHRPEIQVLKEYGDLPTVECYAGQINQVLMSLLVNAIDAIDEVHPEFPQIQIRTQLLSEQIAIHIIDNGSGISEAAQSKLFDPFFTTKPVGSGTGMGLAISYQIVVEKHQGQLLCHSQPGQGAEFVVKIPVCQSKGCQKHLAALTR
jgi:two-component system, NtrC family, sensor kinase